MTKPRQQSTKVKEKETFNTDSDLFFPITIFWQIGICMHGKVDIMS